jgi:hypothetical protein
MFRNQRVVGLSWLAVWGIGPALAILAALALGAFPARAEPAAPAAERVQEAVRTLGGGRLPCPLPRVGGNHP